MSELIISRYCFVAEYSNSAITDITSTWSYKSIDIVCQKDSRNTKCPLKIRTYYISVLMKTSSLKILLMISPKPALYQTRRVSCEDESKFKHDKINHMGGLKVSINKHRFHKHYIHTRLIHHSPWLSIEKHTNNRSYPNITCYIALILGAIILAGLVIHLKSTPFGRIR